MGFGAFFSDDRNCFNPEQHLPRFNFSFPTSVNDPQLKQMTSFFIF